MKEEDYVRTRDGFDRLVSITKDKKYDYYWYRFDKGGTMTNPESGFVIKSSPNIIDLIEVGDYVNGHKVIYTIGNINKRVYVEYVNMDELLEIKLEQITSIVTKEAFESMEYKIGE